MLRRLYVDNYKCFSNFEFKPGPLSLLLGRNGTGKSSVLDVLSSVRALALGHRDVLTAFPSRSRTRWDSRREQAFVLEVAAPFGLCSYALRVEHKSDERLGRVLEETLTVDAQPLFRFTGGDVHLHRDDHSAGPVFPADWSRSALATVPERHDNTKLWWFKRWLERLWVVSIDPREMASESAMETSEPGQRLGDFASWYRHVLQEQPGDLGPLFGELEAVLPGFVSLNLQQVGERARRLTAAFRPAASAAGATPLFGLEELSDGQRCLIALYSLLRLGLRRDTLLCFDEPDNFVALSEIQPWLISLRERVESDGAQALVASHHPEVANYLASDCGQLFERDGLGPVRVRKFVVEPASGLTPAETLARGVGVTLRGVRVTVLCEDTAHERFVRTHLKEHGVDISRHYRALPLCGGDGAGDRYVRDQYADAVRALRSRAHDANVALVVMTDVDTTSADRRRRQLSDALQEEHEAPRGTSERIVLLLPRRNVETWVVHLNGERVDEERDYKPQPQAADVGAAARALREHCRDGGSPCCPDSLLDGCRELQRLDGPSSA